MIRLNLKTAQCQP